MLSSNGNGEWQTLYRCKLCPADTQLFTTAETEVHREAHAGFTHVDFATPRRPTPRDVLETVPPARAPPLRLSILNGTPTIRPRTQTSNIRLPIPGQSGSISMAISVTVQLDENAGVAAAFPSVAEGSAGNSGLPRDFNRTSGMSAWSVSILNGLVQRGLHRPMEPRAPIQQNSATGNADNVQRIMEILRSGRGGVRRGISRARGTNAIWGYVYQICIFAILSFLSWIMHLIFL